MLINSASFGGLTVFAGWAALGRPVTSPIVAVAIGFFFLFAGFYPLTQIYQMDEDRSRCDSTSHFHSAGGTPFSSRLGGRQPGLRLVPGRSLGSLPHLAFNPSSGRVALWYVLLFGWLRRSATAERAYEQRGFYTALWIWALTDVAMVVAMTPVF